MKVQNAPNQPLVAIVVLNWNGLADTQECLRSLLNISYTNYRIVVVDNGSEGDEALRLREEFGQSVHIIENERNYGFAGGCNIGMRHALTLRPDYMLLLNNDTIVDPDFLTAMVEAARTLPDLAAACPRSYFYASRAGAGASETPPYVIYSTGGSVNLWAASSRQVGRGQRDEGQFERLQVRDYADGVCMLIPAAALERVGLLDEDYFAYWEETDWCFRARDLDLRCYYVPGASIWHKAARSVSPGSGFYYLFRRNALLFVRKRGKPYHVASALLLYIFWHGPRYLVRHPSHIGRLLAEARALAWHVRNRAKRQPLG